MAFSDHGFLTPLYPYAVGSWIGEPIKFKFVAEATDRVASIQMKSTQEESQKSTDSDID